MHHGSTLIETLNESDLWAEEGQVTSFAVLREQVRFYCSFSQKQEH